jgi:anti-sigma factor RsiW
MSLCESIDTLAMAYLDDELAAEERHELEAHLTECGSCRTHLDTQRADHALIQRALVVAPASDLVRAKIARSLDRADAEHAKEQRRRWYQWVLPGSAMAAAAAAIVLFLGTQTQPERAAGTVAQQASKHVSRTLPLEVQGPSTGPWLNQHFAAVKPPNFKEVDETQLLGARLLPGAINGHDAAALSYQIRRGTDPFILSVLVVRDLGEDEMRDGTPMRVNNRTVYVLESAPGQSVVSYVDRNHMGYMFMAPELSVNELVWLVSRTDLVGPQ